MSVAVRVTGPLQVFVPALRLLVFSAAASHVTFVLFLLVILTLNSPLWASNGPGELRRARLLSLIHEHLIIQLVDLDHLIDGVSLVGQIPSVRAYRIFLSLMVDYCVPSILIGTASLRSLHFERLRYLDVLRGSSHKVDNVAAKNHFLLGETIPEELVQGD